MLERGQATRRHSLAYWLRRDPTSVRDLQRLLHCDLPILLGLDPQVRFDVPFRSLSG